MRLRARSTRVFVSAAFGIAVLPSLPIVYLAVHYWIKAPAPAELPFHAELEPRED